jgi:ABC-type uncharacterized transport system substrate-binding protein
MDRVVTKLVFEVLDVSSRALLRFLLREQTDIARRRRNCRRLRPSSLRQLRLRQMVAGAQLPHAARELELVELVPTVNIRRSGGAMRSMLAVALLLSATAATAQQLTGKTVLFINSYHAGYPWSDGEEAGASKALAPTGATLKFYRMDSKRHPEDAFMADQSRKLLTLIQTEKPDIVIAADDNATRVMVEHFKDVSLPWVFCGVNWDASPYGLPFKNATGMLEVSLTKSVIERLKEQAKGSRTGFLTADTETERSEGRAYRQMLKLSFQREAYVKSFAEWKEAFLQMQEQTDVVFIGNYAGINDWNETEARAFVQEHTKIPSGSEYDFMMPYVMLGMTKVAEEQGRWAAETAATILEGRAPSTIPIVANKEEKLYVNVGLASKAGIRFSPELLKRAVLIK